ncbi:MAG: capsular biosynthesis protein, partial [Rikenellaceae bacterium]|nr:capsular biosynthesis protein [Rikenellaceae bacterium]
MASGLLDGQTDYHSHILPGVDDGIRTLEDALAALDYAALCGVERIVPTPHIMEDYPKNRPATLRVRFDELFGAYRGPVALSLAAEYMLDGAFGDWLDSGDLLPLADGHLLVEVSCAYEPVNLTETAARINSAGYYAVLAHPERYGYMNMKNYKTLKARNVRFQLNLPYLTGAYGCDAAAKAIELLKAGYYDLASSDL